MGYYMLKQFINSIVDNQRNIKIATTIFFASLVAGYFFVDINSGFINNLLNQFAGIVEKIQESDNALYISFFIFINNLKAALLMIILGLFFGVFPILALAINGMLIGFVLKLIAINSGNLLMFFIFGILPHGIFEIPAIIIAAALGMKLGFSIFSLGRKNRKWSINGILKQALITILGVTLILFIAAIIEGTVTGYLLSSFVL